MLAFCSCLHWEGELLPVQAHWFDLALEKMERLGVKRLFCCGDVYDRGRIGDRFLPAPALIRPFTFLVEKHQIPVTLVNGNHDLNGADLAPATEVFRGHPLITLPPDEGWRGLCTTIQEVDGLRVLGFSWPEDMPEFEFLGALQQVCRVQQPDIVFGHLELSGAVYDSGRVSQRSDVWPRPSAAAVAAAAAPAGMVVLGHLHKRQEYFPNGVPVLYPGALLRRNWGEANNPDGFMILHNGSYRFVELRGPVYQEVEQLPDNAPYGSKFRCSTPRSLNPYVPTGVTVEFVRKQEDLPAPELKERVTEIRMGQSPAEMLQYYLSENQPSENLVPILSVLASLDKEQKTLGAGVGVQELRSICVENTDNGTLTVALRPGWNVLFGGVGRGKTTLLESVHAALFGSWLSESRGPLRSAFPTGKGTIKIEALLLDGSEPTVIRKLEEEQSAYVFIGSGKHAGPKVSEVQAWLNQRVGRSEDWKRLSVLIQSPKDDLVECGDAERMSTLRRLMGLDHLEVLRKAAADEMKTLSYVVSEIENKNGLISEHRQRLEARQAEIAELEEQEQQAEAKIEGFKAEQAIIAEEVKAFSAWHAANTQAQNLEKLVQETQRQIDTLKQQLTGPTEEELSKLRNEWEQAEERHKGLLRLHSERSLHISSVAQLKQKTRNLELAGCRTQGPESSTYLPCPFIKEAIEAQAQLELAEADFKEAHDKTKFPSAEELQAAEKHSKECSLRLGVARQSFSHDSFTRGELSGEEKKLASHQQALKELVVPEPPSTSPGRMKSIVALYEQVTNDLNQTQGQLQQYRTLKATKTGGQGELEKNIVRLQKEVQELESKAERHRFLGIIAGAFSRTAIPLILIEQSIPELQREIDQLCMELGSEFQIKLGAGGDGADLPILVKRGSSRWADARVRSGGERGFLRLLLRCALMRWNARDGKGRVLLLDEPTSHMDPEFSEAAVQMLRGLVGPDRPFSQAIVATHDDVLADEIGHKISV